MTIEWHPITKIPPTSNQPTIHEYSKHVLVYGTSLGTPMCFTAHYNITVQRWLVFTPHYVCDFIPTHWCDLPTPPEISNESS